MRALGLGLLLIVNSTVLAQDKLANESPVPAMPAPEAQGARLLSIASSGYEALAVGEQGVILRSTDGKVWNQVDSPVSNMMTRVRYNKSDQAWALGYDYSILHSGDAGQTWQLKNWQNSGRALFDIHFSDAKRGVAVGGYGYHMITDDGGQSWQEVDSDLSYVGMHMFEIAELGDGSLFATGERGMMARSTDSGRSWQVLDAPYGGSFFGAVPWGERGVLVYGMRGHVFVAPDITRCATADAQTWDPYEREINRDGQAIALLGWWQAQSSIEESLFAAWGNKQKGVIFVGVNGTVLGLKADEAELETLSSPASETLSGITKVRSHLLVVGRRGIQPLQVSNWGAAQ